MPVNMIPLMIMSKQIDSRDQSIFENCLLFGADFFLENLLKNEKKYVIIFIANFCAIYQRGDFHDRHSECFVFEQGRIF
jgi:hypothetical protein